MGFSTLLLLLFSSFIVISAVPSVRLNNGVEIPIIGIGTGGHNTDEGIPKGETVIQMIKDALDAGYRHIDTSDTYGNEKEIGDALAAKIKEGVVKREEVFITTKFTPDSSGQKHAADAIKSSLSLLKVEYLDLFLIHRPTGAYVDAYKAMEEGIQNGTIRSIGVSNFGQKELDNLLKSAIIKPAINQIESHPKRIQQDLIDYSQKNGLSITAYSPLGSGNLLNDTTVEKIAANHNKTAAQVLIRFEVQRGIITIPKSTNKERIAQNIDVFDFNLTDMEIETLKNLK